MSAFIELVVNDTPTTTTEPSSEDKGKGKRPVAGEDGASGQAGSAVGHPSAAYRGDEEPHSQIAARDLDAPVLFSTIQNYWLKHNPLTDSTSCEAVEEKSKDNLYALKRLFALSEILVPFTIDDGHRPEDADSRRRRDNATSLHNELVEKIDDVVCALQATGCTSKLSEDEVCTMGVDKSHEVDFRDFIYPKLCYRAGVRNPGIEPHASCKVIEMTPTQWKEASKHFAEAKALSVASLSSSEVQKKIKRQLLVKTWARLLCLYHKPFDTTAKDKDFDKLKDGVRGKMNSQRETLKKMYLQADAEEKKEMRPWKDPRDPEFRRILKVQFETLATDGKPIEEEPYASEKVTKLEPRQVKEALVWFVDLKESKVYLPSGDEAKTLRDWKRLVALRVRAEEIRASSQAAGLNDPTDRINPGKDILKEAEVRICALASMIKLCFHKNAERPAGFKKSVLDMDRDDYSEDMRNAFRDSFNKYIERNNKGQTDN